MADQVITRFAPSPTGHLHIGGARTALFCWAFARRHGGRFVLRIEDTDQARSSESSTRGILEDLAWLGLDWDDGPVFEGRIGVGSRDVGAYFQSERIGIYTGYIDRLVEQGLAYPAFDTPEELAELRAEAEARKETFKYRRPADWDRDRALGRLREGESCVIRFASPDEAIVVKDEVLGEVRFDGGELEDFVIRKADGYPTYHFAVVVDDALMGVTHVLRGQEHLMNTPKHVALQEAMGLPVPHYAHLPLIFNPDGSKMSKRDKDKAVRAEARRHEGTEARSGELGISAEEYRAWLGDKTRQLPADVLRVLAKRLGVVLPEIDVDDFRRSGYLPEVVLNYIALLGWNPGEKNADGTDVERFGMDYLASHFSIERIGKKASKFDREKLRAFNADRVQKELSAVEFAAAWRGWLERYDAGTLAALGDRFELAAKAVQARTTTLADAIEPVRFAVIADEAVEFDEKAVEKVLLKDDGEGLRALEELAGVLGRVEPFEAEAIEGAVKVWCEGAGVGMGKAAQPLRVAVTGGTVSPGLGETLALVGREGVLARIGRCIRACRG
jgi:glutamyl-tRNA synthetase